MAATPGLADKVTSRVQQHLGSAVTKMSAMQPNPLGAFPTNKNARNAIWNHLVSLDAPEKQAILETMAKKAKHEPGEKDACELCKFVMEHLPDTPAVAD